MKLPEVTPKQQDILKLLYTYRYLNRIQIQTLMGHKNKKNINVWLKDLRDKHCVEWIYSADFLEKTKPAIYYLGASGIRFMKSTDEYSPEEVRKRYKDESREPDFIARSVLIADCCISLRAQSIGEIGYSFTTQSDYAEATNRLHFLNEELKPHLCFTKQQDTPEGSVTTNYLLDIFDASLPHYRLRYRLKAYLNYLALGDWENNSPDDKVPPQALLVCQNLAQLIYAKRRIRSLIADSMEDCSSVQIRLTTVAKLKERGITESIWEKA